MACVFWGRWLFFIRFHYIRFSRFASRAYVILLSASHHKTPSTLVHFSSVLNLIQSDVLGKLHTDGGKTNRAVSFIIKKTGKDHIIKYVKMKDEVTIYYKLLEIYMKFHEKKTAIVL